MPIIHGLIVNVYMQTIPSPNGNHVKGEYCTLIPIPYYYVVQNQHLLTTSLVGRVRDLIS